MLEITKQKPAPGVMIGKYDPLYFTVECEVTGLATLRVEIDGVLVHTSRIGMTRYWMRSEVTSATGVCIAGSIYARAVLATNSFAQVSRVALNFVLKAIFDFPWRPGEHRLRVTVTPDEGIEQKATSSFLGPERPFLAEAYRFVFDGLREADEEE